MIQRYNHTDGGMTPCTTGYWYREEDIAQYLPTAHRPLSIKLLFAWIVLFTIISGGILYWYDSRMDKFENDLKRADYSKEFCKGY